MDGRKINPAELAKAYYRQATGIDGGFIYTAEPVRNDLQRFVFYDPASPDDIDLSERAVHGTAVPISLEVVVNTITGSIESADLRRRGKKP